MNTCSCLTLILACIVYWQAREISRVLSQCDPAANGVDLSLLEHISPIEWDNVVLYGQYIPRSEAYPTTTADHYGMKPKFPGRRRGNELPVLWGSYPSRCVDCSHKANSARGDVR